MWPFSKNSPDDVEKSLPGRITSGRECREVQPMPAEEPESCQSVSSYCITEQPVEEDTVDLTCCFGDYDAQPAETVTVTFRGREYEIPTGYPRRPYSSLSC